MFNLGQVAGRFLENAPKEMPHLRVSDRWITTRFSKTVESVTAELEEYGFDKAMREVEQFIWHDFADDYVEMVKSRSDDAVRYTVYNVFLGAIKLLAPFMPHVTEEVYQTCFKATEGCRSIHLTSWPEPILIDEDAEAAGEVLRAVLAEIRAWKGERKIPLNAELKMLELVGADAAILESSKADIMETTKAVDVRIAPDAQLTEEVVGVKPVHSKLGPAFKAQAKAIVAAVAAIDPKDAAAALSKGAIEVDANGEKVTVPAEYFELDKRLMLDGKAVETIQIGNVLALVEL